MTLRFIRHRLLILLGLAALLATLAACDTTSNAPPATTPIPPAATTAPATPATGAPTAALPASPPTAVTDQVPQAVPTGGAGQVPQAVPTGGANQVPQAVPTGSPALVTPGAVDPEEPPRISLDDLQQLLTKPDTLLVDVRTEASYQERHIKGAVSFPFPTIEEHIQDVPKDKFIVAYCQ